MCWQLLSHWSQNNKSHQAFFKRRPASFRVNCAEKESNVRMKSNFKTYSGKALQIAWALGGEESRSHTDFSKLFSFQTIFICLVVIHISYMFHLYYSVPKLEEFLYHNFFNISIPLSSYMKGAQLKWCAAEDEWILCHLLHSCHNPQSMFTQWIHRFKPVQLLSADHTHTHCLPHHPERGWMKFPLLRGVHSKARGHNNGF